MDISELLARHELGQRDFRKVDLDGANLESADLEGAILENASLFGVNLEGSILKAANLSGALLQEGNLKGANLQNANLTCTTLGYANLEAANLENANLSNADLTYANLKNANLENANLSNAGLGNANLKNANLKKANLENAELTYASLESADMTEANLHRADLSMSNLANVWLFGANLHNANLSYAYLLGSYLSHKDLIGVNLEGTILSKEGIIRTTKIDWKTLLEAQQLDFIERFKSGHLLHCKSEGCHSELTVVSAERTKQLRDFSGEMAEKYKRNSPVRKVFIDNMKGKLGEEVVKARLSEFITEVDYEQRLDGDGKVDFRLASNPAVGIQVKARQGKIDSVQWWISQEEVQKNAALVCILIQEEVNEAQAEYNLILAGFLPISMITLSNRDASFKINQLLYGGGLRYYLQSLNCH